MNQENIQVIEKHISNLGFADVYAFALEQLILSNQKVLEETNSRIDFFESKYELDYENFCEQFHEIEGDLLQKEDDSMDWQMEILRKKTVESELEELEKLKPDDDEPNI